MFFLDATRIKQHELVLVFKLNKLKVNNGTNIKICKIIQGKMSVENVLTFYTLAKLYNLNNVAQSSLITIERCFQVLSKCQNFLHLDLRLISKILSSSGLNIHTEVEVFDAVNTWLKHNKEERSQHAKHLLLTVRLSLLSADALEYIVHRKLFLTKNIECVEILNAALANKKTLDQNKPSIYCTSRYCNQDKFDILICGGWDCRSKKVVKSVLNINASDKIDVQTLPPMTKERRFFKAVCLMGEIYVLDGLDNNNNFIKSIEKYSPSTKTWSRVAGMFDCRKDFGVCAFVDQLFVVDGCFYQNDSNASNKITNSCLKFDTKEKIWIKVSNTKGARSCAACAVFQGSIVVSGGHGAHQQNLNTVESYDVFADEWSPLPSMVNGKSDHSLVAVKDKLFAIGNGSDVHTSYFEVLDAECDRFVALTPLRHLRFQNAVSVENGIVIFKSYSSYVYFYSFEKQEWSKESFEATMKIMGFACAKLPWYKCV